LGLWRRSIYLVLAVPLLSGLAWGQDADLADGVRDLRAKLRFVEHFKRCHEQLAKETNALFESNRSSRELGEIRGRVYLEWGKYFANRGEDIAAFKRYETVRSLGEEYTCHEEATGRAAGAARRIADLHGEGEEEQALEWLGKALERYRSLGEKARDEVEQVTLTMAETSATAGLKAFDRKDYDRAYDLLRQVAGKYPKIFSKTEGGDRLRFLRESTGVLTVEKIRVRHPGTAAMTGTRFRLTPRGTGEPRELEPFSSVRWNVGEYDCSVLVAGGPDTPLITLPVTIAREGGTLRIPEKFPHGMVYVHGSADVPHFFIQIREVTVAEFREFEKDYEPAHPGDQLPAHGISFERAEAYADNAGMKLPSEAQWKLAVFGGRTTGYPWGDEAPSPERCNIGGKRPMEVGGRPAGSSVPYGLLDAAGNVWEWLDNGYAIGGGNGHGWLEVELEDWGGSVDYLRDPLPGLEVWNKVIEDQGKYDTYHLRSDLVEVGLRCVIELN
jgi:tetratricopeptide (TPR) repeat protein